MKSLLIHIDDKEYERLIKIKGKSTWKLFLMYIADKKQIIEEIGEFDIKQIEKVTDSEDKEFFELIKKLTE